jgi:hypothetical protein
MAEPEKNRVVVLFDIDSEGSVSVLDSRDGIRVYKYPNGVDPIVGDVDSIPLFDRFQDAVEHIVISGGHSPVFLAYSEAKRVFSDNSFAEH